MKTRSSSVEERWWGRDGGGADCGRLRWRRGLEMVQMCRAHGGGWTRNASRPQRRPSGLWGDLWPHRCLFPTFPPGRTPEFLPQGGRRYLRDPRRWNGSRQITSCPFLFFNKPPSIPSTYCAPTGYLLCACCVPRIHGRWWYRDLPTRRIHPCPRKALQLVGETRPSTDRQIIIHCHRLSEFGIRIP